MKYLCFSHENGDTIDDGRYVVAQTPEGAAEEWASLEFYGIDGSFERITVTVVQRGALSEYVSWEVVVRVVSDPMFCAVESRRAA